MTKLTYLSSTALCAFALAAAITPAAADGGMGAGNQFYGSADVGYNWTNYSPNGASDYHSGTFVGQGAIGMPFGNGWFGEGNFSFESQQFNNVFGPGSTAIDTWQVGALVGYNFDGQGRLGVDLAYQTLDFGFSVDGYRAGIRGEYYLNRDATLRAGVGYQDYNQNGIEGDGVYANGGGSYYFNRNLGIRGDVDYFKYDLTGFGPHTNFDVWALGGKLQYKLDDCPVILGGGVTYGDINGPFGVGDNHAWQFGLDITAKFGSGAPAKSLAETERTSTFEPSRIGVAFAPTF
jgi:hypothetical protein